MASESLQAKYDAAKAMQQSQQAEAISQLRDIVLGQHPNDAEAIKVTSQQSMSYQSCAVA